MMAVRTERPEAVRLAFALNVDNHIAAVPNVA
jgi:hypothetical protein